MFFKKLNLFKSHKKKFKENLRKEKKRIYLQPNNNFLSSKNHVRSQIKKKIYINLAPNVILSSFAIIALWGCVGIILLFKGSYFSIKNIEIYSQNSIANIDLAYKAVEGIRHKNIFLTKAKSIQQSIEIYQKNIQITTVEKTLPSTLKISIESFPILLRMIQKNEKYYISSNGVAIPEKNIKFSPQGVNDIILKISNKSDFNTKISYQKIINVSLLNNVFLLIKYFKKNLVSIQINNITLHLNEREIHILTKDNTQIIFDINSNIINQVKSLSVFQKENLKLKYVYLDMRIPNKIFYCNYKNEFLCKRNLKSIYK